MPQQKAATALLGGSTVAAAASAGGVSDRTVYRWLADTEGDFARFLEEVRHAQWLADRGRLDALRGVAIDYLGEVLCSEGITGPQVSAALSVLSRTGVPERREIEQRTEVGLRDPELESADSRELRRQLRDARGAT